MEQRSTFPKQERLCGRSRFTEVVEQGRAVNVPPFRLVGRPMSLEGAADLQVAFAVPRRNLRLAVDRNRTRRRMREAYRLARAPHLNALSGSGVQLAWLFVYQGRRVPAWDEVREKISACMDRWMKEHHA